MVRTLIVEDSALFRQVFQEVLHARFPSMEITERPVERGAGGDQRPLARSRFCRYQPAGENGLELAHKIKTEYPDLVTIILTNYDFPEYREAALRYKTNHFLPKDSFFKMIDAILLKGHPSGSPGEE